ncbi:MAG TPA: condensation domain-containing protein, partial [Thermoanaerobaculia bacterium]|nr:condensation domain-containing protein [Thermoanaerobaculia bacterium]
YAHQDLPFTKLVEALRPDRAASRTPLFQVMFLLQNAPAEPLEVPGAGLTLTPVEWQVQVATFDLTLVLDEAGDPRGGLGGWLWYNCDLLDAGSVAALGERFRLLLESAVADPGRRLSELSLVTEEERRQLLAGPRTLFERHTGLEPGANAETVETVETGLDLSPEQAALLDRLAAEGGIDERDVWAHPASGPAGSPSLAELGARLSGGSLIAPEVVPEDPAVTPEAIADLVKGERVTVLTLSPALFEDLAAWMAAAPRRDASLRSLRWVIVDGEPAAAAVRAWRERFGERRARVVEAPANPAVPALC